jgi:hypothetical protein
MSSKTQKNQTLDQTDDLLGIPPLLITESAHEFAALLLALQREIKPNGIIEQIYLADLAAIVWEIQRLRRYRTGIVNNAFRAALQKLLKHLLLTPDILSRIESEARASALADDWFTGQRGKKEVLAILRRFDLDEAAIEAEAIRLSWSDLELVDKMQMSLRARLDRALVSVAAYRDGFVKLVRQSSGLIIENDNNDVVCLENFAGKKSA